MRSFRNSSKISVPKLASQLRSLYTGRKAWRLRDGKGNYDGDKPKKLVEKDERKGVKVGTVAGDKGYDDGDNHYYLKEKGINSAIRLNGYRTDVVGLRLGQ